MLTLRSCSTAMLPGKHLRYARPVDDLSDNTATSTSRFVNVKIFRLAEFDSQSFHFFYDRVTVEVPRVYLVVLAPESDRSQNVGILLLALELGCPLLQILRQCSGCACYWLSNFPVEVGCIACEYVLVLDSGISLLALPETYAPFDRYNR